MNIDLYTYSGIGDRPINEDSLACGEGYYVVSDGLGGHDNGEVASAAAVNYIANNYSGDISAESAAALITGADNAVRTLGGSGKATVAALFTNNDKVRIANIGDSRVYYFRRGRVFFRTKDHSVCQASVDMGEMTDEEVRHSADRSGLLKVLGDTDPVRLPKPYDLIDPEDGDAFLICSDGFWEHIYDAEMEADLLKSADSREWMDHMLKRILLRSENKGDNFTAVCGMIHAPEKPPKPLSFLENTASDYPTTLEINNAPGNTSYGRSSNKNLIIVGAIAAVAVIVIGVLVALLIANSSKGDPADSSSSAADNPPSSSVIEPSESGVPSNPGDPENPDNPDNPGDPENPDNPGDPGNPGDPENPDNPGDPGNPGDPENPDDPGDPDNPGDPENPEDPGDPDNPDNPGDPVVPGDPGDPDDPSIPAVPDNPLISRPPEPTEITQV